MKSADHPQINQTGRAPPRAPDNLPLGLRRGCSHCSLVDEGQVQRPATLIFTVGGWAYKLQMKEVCAEKSKNSLPLRYLIFSNLICKH